MATVFVSELKSDRHNWGLGAGLTRFGPVSEHDGPLRVSVFEGTLFFF